MSSISFNVLVIPSAQLIEQIQVKDPYLLDCLRALSGESQQTQTKLLALFQSVQTIINNTEESDNFEDAFLLMGA